jgi:uncharacterized protein YegJ (DUF2314 family)
MRLATILALSIFTAAGVVPLAAAEEDHVIMIPRYDPEMDAAVTRARATLWTFWKAYKSHDPNLDAFNLKVEIKDWHGTEYFWLDGIVRNGAKLSGVINNTPEIVANVRLDERYTFKEADIVDWMFVRKGKVVGNETGKVLMRRFPPEKRKLYEEMYEKP